MKHPPFARLFETPSGQLLVTKEWDEGDGEGIALRFDSSIKVEITSFYDSAGERDAAFAKLDQVFADQQAARMAATAMRFGGKAA